MAAVETAERMVEHWEGFAKLLPDGRVQAYWDKIGRKWTIGSGITGPDVFEGVIWTAEQCRNRTLDFLSNLTDHISRMLTRPVTVNQMAAMVDLAYNTGLDEKADGIVSAFGIDSSILKNVNRGEFDAAADGFLQWCHARDENGQLYVVEGLLNRRRYDRGVFRGEINP